MSCSSYTWWWWLWWCWNTTSGSLDDLTTPTTAIPTNTTAKVLTLISCCWQQRFVDTVMFHSLVKGTNRTTVSTSPFSNRIDLFLNPVQYWRHNLRLNVMLCYEAYLLGLEWRVHCLPFVCVCVWKRTQWLWSADCRHRPSRRSSTPLLVNSSSPITFIQVCG